MFNCNLLALFLDMNKIMFFWKSKK